MIIRTKNENYLTSVVILRLKWLQTFPRGIIESVKNSISSSGNMEVIELRCFYVCPPSCSLLAKSV